MVALQDIPPPHPAVTIALLGLVALLWVALRVQILRRRQALREPGEPRVPAPEWMHRLASWPGTNWRIALLGAGFAALLVVGLSG